MTWCCLPHQGHFGQLIGNNSEQMAKRNDSVSRIMGTDGHWMRLCMLCFEIRSRVDLWNLQPTAFISSDLVAAVQPLRANSLRAMRVMSCPVVLESPPNWLPVALKLTWNRQVLMSCHLQYSTEDPTVPLDQRLCRLVCRHVSNTTSLCVSSFVCVCVCVCACTWPRLQECQPV